MTLAIFLLSISLSCSQDSSDPSPGTQVIAPNSVAEIEEILSSTNMKSWNTKDFSLAGMKLDCRMDDSFDFFSDHSFKFYGGDQLCGLEDILREREGTWMVDLENNKVVFTLSTGETYNAKYEKLTDEELRLTGTWGGMKIIGVFVPSDS